MVNSLQHLRYLRRNVDARSKKWGASRLSGCVQRANIRCVDRANTSAPNVAFTCAAIARHSVKAALVSCAKGDASAVVKEAKDSD
jgi:hypothetical protein